jgi:hypothetical protein
LSHRRFSRGCRGSLPPAHASARARCPESQWRVKSICPSTSRRSVFRCSCGASRCRDGLGTPRARTMAPADALVVPERTTAARALALRAFAS